MLLGLYYFITFLIVPIQPPGCNIAINVSYRIVAGKLALCSWVVFICYSLPKLQIGFSSFWNHSYSCSSYAAKFSHIRSSLYWFCQTLSFVCLRGFTVFYTLIPIHS